MQVLRSVVKISIFVRGAIRPAREGDWNGHLETEFSNYFNTRKKSRILRLIFEWYALLHQTVARGVKGQTLSRAVYNARCDAASQNITWGELIDRSAQFFNMINCRVVSVVNGACVYQVVFFFWRVGKSKLIWKNVRIGGEGLCGMEIFRKKVVVMHRALLSIADRSILKHGKK